MFYWISLDSMENKQLSTLILIMIGTFRSAHAQCAGLRDDSTAPPTCFTYHSSARSFSDALRACEATPGTTLARVQTENQHNMIRSLIESNEGSGAAPFYTWMGARVRDQTPVDIWRWLDGNVEASGQGCYYQYQNNDVSASVRRDFRNEITLSINTPMRPEKCIDACRDSGYHYAGLQDGDECWCDGEFGLYGGNSSRHSHRCTLACPETDSNAIRCGGVDRNEVYAVNGSFSTWGYAKPNNYTGYQACAVMSSGVGYKFDDEDCFADYGRSFICQIRRDAGSCLGADGAGSYRLVDGGCYYFRESDEEKSWFQAEELCMERGGNLVTIHSQEEFDALKNEIESIESSERFTKYWIGLRSRVWEWTTGDQMRFYKWGFERPNGRNNLCATYKYDGDYSEWEDADCGDVMPYVCQYVDPALTTTTTTPSTTRPTTTTSTTTTTTTRPTTTTARPTTTIQPTSTTTTPTTTTTPPTTTIQPTTTTTTPTTITARPTTTQPTTTTTSTTTTTTQPPTTTTQPTSTTTRPTTTTTQPTTTSTQLITTTTRPTTTTTQPTTTTTRPTTATTQHTTTTTRITTTATQPITTTTERQTTTTSTTTVPTSPVVSSTPVASTPATSTQTSTTPASTLSASTAQVDPTTDGSVPIDAPSAGASSNNDDDDDLGTLEILLIVFVLILVILVVIAVIAFCVIRHKNQQKTKVRDTTVYTAKSPAPLYTGYNLDDWYSNTAHSRTGLVDMPKKNRRAYHSTGSPVSGRSHRTDIHITDGY